MTETAQPTAPAPATKNALLSKTICLNLVVAAAAIVKLYNEPAASWLTDHAELVCLVATNVVNIGLRFWTKQPLSLR